MSLNPDADKPKAYRLRLLQVLLSDDLKELIGWDSGGNVIDNRYVLLQHWNSNIEAAVFDLIKRRLAQ